MKIDRPDDMPHFSPIQTDCRDCGTPFQLGVEALREAFRQNQYCLRRGWPRITKPEISQCDSCADRDRAARQRHRATLHRQFLELWAPFVKALKDGSVDAVRQRLAAFPPDIRMEYADEIQRALERHSGGGE